MSWLGVVLALTTSVAWACGNVLTGRAAVRVGVARALLWSMLAGAALAMPCALLLDDVDVVVTPTAIAWAFAAAVAAIVAYVGLFTALASAALTVTVPLVSSWPLIAALLAVVVLHEPVHVDDAVGFALVFIGVLLVALPRKTATTETTETSEAKRTSTKLTPKAAVAAIAASLGFGVMVPAMGQLATSTGAFGASVVVTVLAVIIVLPFTRLLKIDLRLPAASDWPLVIATGSVETLGFITVALARRFAPMTVVAPVASLAATLTVLYAWLVLGERPARTAIVGALLASIGVVVLAL